MSEQSVPESELPSWDDSPLALNVIHALIEKHPNWRLTSQFTGGNEVMMIEFADDDGELPSGELPWEFVSMIADYGRGDDE